MENSLKNQIDEAFSDAVFNGGKVEVAELYADILHHIKQRLNEYINEEPEEDEE